MARRARDTAGRVPLLHGHGVLQLPRGRARFRHDLGELFQPAIGVEPRALGRAHRHRPRAEDRRHDPCDPRRPRRGAQAGPRSPGPALVLDIVDFRPRSRARTGRQRPLHAGRGECAPQGRETPRRRRRPGPIRRPTPPGGQPLQSPAKPQSTPPGTAPAGPPRTPGQRKSSNPRPSRARPGRTHAGRRGRHSRRQSVHPWRPA